MAKKGTQQPAASKTRKTKASKKPKTRKVVAPVAKPIVYAPIPSVIALTEQTGRLLWKFKELLGSITVVYGLLSLLLVRGLGAGVNFAELREQVGGFSAYAQLLSNPSGTSTQAAGVYQIFLFIIVSLAVIWALRQSTAGDSVTTRDAFYRGMHPLVPFILVLLVIGFQLIPTMIGIALYQFAVVGGVATSTVEVALCGLGVLALSLVSLYFLASSLMALYIVTLPSMTPLLALQTARRLVRGRRWTILRKVLFLPLAVFVAMAVVMIPFALLVPVLASWVLFAFGAAALVVGHAYLYNLYQELLNEEQATD